MRADRFGSYSIVETFPGCLSCPACQVDDECGTAACRLRRATTRGARHVVAAAGHGAGSRRAACAARWWWCRERLDRLKAPAGRRWFISFNRHLVSPLEELAAFRLRAISGADLPVRGLPAPGASPFRLPMAVRVRLWSTRQLDAVHLAVLAACVAKHQFVATRSRWMDVFSVMSGRRIT